MCSRIECSTCHKPTYAGCGMHIEQVLGNVPREERCKCREKTVRPGTGGAGAGKGPAEAATPASVLRRWFGG